MGTHTPNLNLFKPAKTDTSEVIADLNENWDKIDSPAANYPSADQKAALDGTGTPSSTNKYVTDDDARMTDDRDPTTDTSHTWTKSQIGSIVTLTDAATIAVDASNGNNFRVVLGGNRTLGNPTNAVGGWTFNILIKQDGTGSRTLAYGNKYAFVDGEEPTLSEGANEIDILSGYYDNTEDKFFCVLNNTFEVPT